MSPEGQTLRFYERQCLLPGSAWTTASYRDYPPKMADRIGDRPRRTACGFTLAQIAESLAVRAGGTAPCGHVVQLLDRRLGDIETALAPSRRSVRVRALRDRARQLNLTECAAEDVCSAALTGR